jgi:hypothetical protein
MNFCKPSSAAPPPSPVSPLPPRDNHNPYGTAEDYGLSDEFYSDYTNGIVRPDISVSTSGRVLETTNGTPLHLPHMRGDATLRPNTGNSNQLSGDMLGSLQETTSFLRWTTIASTVAAIVWEGFAFPLRLIGTILVHPAQVVLGAYLGIFCLLILGAELNNIYLRDNFGFLFYPLSRGFCLLLMSSMSLGILKSWWESLLGLAFLVVGCGYIYTYVAYPEYRRWQNYNERMPTAWQEAKMYWTPTATEPTRQGWTDTNRATESAALIARSSEVRSLLQSI